VYFFGAVQDKGTWRKRNNHDFFKLFNEPNILKYININRLSWAGRTICLENSRTVKKVIDTRPEGTRKTGGPKLRWEDGVIQDIRALGVKNSRNEAMNREDWLKLLKKARKKERMNHEEITLSLPVMHFMVVTWWGQVDIETTCNVILENIFQ
jgi:hypothetical protein